MDERDVMGAGIGSGIVGAIMFGIIALMAIQFQLGDATSYYVVGGAALFGAFIFGVIGRAATRRLPPRAHP